MRSEFDSFLSHCHSRTSRRSRPKARTEIRSTQQEEAGISCTGTAAVEEEEEEEDSTVRRNT